MRIPREFTDSELILIIDRNIMRTRYCNGCTDKTTPCYTCDYNMTEAEEDRDTLLTEVIKLRKIISNIPLSIDEEYALRKAVLKNCSCRSTPKTIDIYKSLVTKGLVTMCSGLVCPTEKGIDIVNKIFAPSKKLVHPLTTELYFDCHCTDGSNACSGMCRRSIKNVTHVKDEATGAYHEVYVCSNCGANSDDMPDSHLNEVLHHLSYKIRYSGDKFGDTLTEVKMYLDHLSTHDNLNSEWRRIFKTLLEWIGTGTTADEIADMMNLKVTDFEEEMLSD